MGELTNPNNFLYVLVAAGQSKVLCLINQAAPVVDALSQQCEGTGYLKELKFSL